MFPASVLQRGSFLKYLHIMRTSFFRNLLQFLRYDFSNLCMCKALSRQSRLSRHRIQMCM
jgi:hypothetical protein